MPWGFTAHLPLLRGYFTTVLHGCLLRGTAFSRASNRRLTLCRRRTLLCRCLSYRPAEFLYTLRRSLPPLLRPVGAGARLAVFLRALCLSLPTLLLAGLPRRGLAI